MSAATDLVLLTLAYPFGNEAETFLEAEIGVLAERFRRVYVLPSRREPGTRALPANVELVEMDWLERPARGSLRRALATREAASVLLRSSRAEVGGRRAPPPRRYLDNLARNLLKRRSLARFVGERGLAGAVFYDYWFENSTLALALLRESGAIRIAVSRVHGFDLYDERWGGLAVPFRGAKARGLDAIFAVSDFGAAYLGERIPAQAEKIAVQRLGVADPGRAGPPRASGAPPLVLTCARLDPQKRIHLVPEALARLGAPVRWIHLGDGPERARVAAAAERLLGREGPGAAWELRGHVDNRDVLDLYAAEHVDALLSLSLSEGLPVSMMEAQSYGVPIVAVEAGGVGEIVGAETGVLLAPGEGPEGVAAGLRAALEPGRFDPEEVRARFRRRFEAGANYNAFADRLLALRDDLQ